MILVGAGSVSPRLRALLDDAAERAGLFPDEIVVVQGSYNAGDLSAGTHAGGGAVDLRVRHLPLGEQLELVQALRRRGVAAWVRNAELAGWTRGDHIHAVARDEPNLSASAARQVLDYDLGLDGLARSSASTRPHHGRDYHPRPPWVAFTYPPPEDDQMELGDRVPKVGGGTMSVAGALAWAVRHAGVAAQYARLTYERVRAVEAGDAALAAKLDTQAASLAAQLEGIEQKLDSLAEPEEETT